TKGAGSEGSWTLFNSIAEGNRHPTTPPTFLLAQMVLALIQVWGMVSGACSHTSPVFLSSTAPVKAVTNRDAAGLLVSHRSVWLSAARIRSSLARISVSGLFPCAATDGTPRP